MTAGVAWKEDIMPAEALKQLEQRVARLEEELDQVRMQLNKRTEAAGMCAASRRLACG